MENKYAVVVVCSEGVNSQVYMCSNKEKARDLLKYLWNKEVQVLKRDCYKYDKSETWCDAEGDCARITYEEDDCICFQVVDVKNAMENPYMPFDIDDTVYYMEKVSERGGHTGYKITKLICCGYYNFGKGWYMRLRKSKYNKFDEYNLPLTDTGYTVFYSKADIKDRVRDLNGFIVE